MASGTGWAKSRSMSYLIRPAKPSDFGAVMELARHAGSGFTSLQPDEDAIQDKLQKVEKSFAAPDDADPAPLAYLLVLEDNNGQVMGCAGVKPSVGIERPYYNFRVANAGYVSFQADRRFDMPLLWLVSEHNGHSEVGSLLLHPDRRGGGVGRMLAQSRYMLVATARHRFADTILAELRGFFDDNNQSPFWAGVTQKFFRMTFEQADNLSATTDGQFLAELLPRHPIYADLLPQPAKDAIGKCHPDGQGAMRLLQWEGFKYRGLVDVFDAGPLVSADTDNVRTIRESQVRHAKLSDTVTGPSAYISNEKFQNFGLTRAPVQMADDTVTISHEVAARLKIDDNAPVRVWVQPERKA